MIARSTVLAAAVALIAAVPWFGNAVLIQFGINALLIATLAQSWNILGGFQIVAFFIYIMAAYAETNRTPFDLPEAESELVAGYHTEYSSMKFAMFFMAEYANMITVACVATLLFLGGATSPFGHVFDSVAILNGPVIGAILPILWFVAKILFFLLLHIWVRGTLPRFRYDQLMNFGWKFLLPVAILNILATALALAYRS